MKITMKIKNLTNNEYNRIINNIFIGNRLYTKNKKYKRRIKNISFRHKNRRNFEKLIILTYLNVKDLKNFVILNSLKEILSKECHGSNTYSNILEYIMAKYM